MSQIGGYTETREADEQIKQLCNQVMDQVEAKTGKAYREFIAMSYRMQVVKGKNYLIKVDVSEPKYLHVLVYQDLSGNVDVRKVEEHNEDDPLVPF